MDPLAHTLVGASLAELSLKQRSAMAVPTLVLGANAPDIDALTILMGGDLSLGFRRGWTHGVLAMMLLPVIMTGLMLLIERIAARCRGRPPRARAGPLLGLSYIAVLTHPALDWLNTYGIRLLMPFDNTWFYGDALFIVDPWIWLLGATTVVLARTKSGPSIGTWLVLGVVVTSLVTAYPGTPAAARLLWVTGIACIVGLRLWGGLQHQLPRLATGCLAGALVYIIVMVGSSRVATHQVRTWLTARDNSPVVIMAAPLPANPFARDIVVADDQHYHFLELDWLANEPIRIVSPSIDRTPHGPVVEAALAAPHIQGLITWIRFPAYEVEETPTGYRVSITDVRYVRRVGTSLGTAVVELDRNLHVR